MTTRRSQAHDAHDRELREAAKTRLKYPPVSWTGEQARGIARGFATSFQDQRVTVHACSILPEHIHLVVQRPPSRTKIERIVNVIKGAATRQLTTEGIHPFKWIVLKSGRHPKMFARNCWKVFLDSEADFFRAVRYVEENPAREGKKRQRWKFVQSLGCRA